MEWYEILISILTGFATAIPLIVELVKYVKEAAKEKNWSRLVSLVLTLIQEAEEKFEDGADRREWVLSMVQASADTINYDINIDLVGELVDNLCTMSKNVNVQKEVTE